MAILKEPFPGNSIRSLEDYKAYRKWISEQQNPELDEFLESFNRTIVPFKPVKTDFELMSEMLDKEFSTKTSKHSELYDKDLSIGDGKALYKAIIKVVNPCAANGFCRIPRTWWAELRLKFWKWYAKKFPKKVKYNRHVALVNSASRILRNLEKHDAKHKQD